MLTQIIMFILLGYFFVGTLLSVSFECVGKGKSLHLVWLWLFVLIYIIVSFGFKCFCWILDTVDNIVKK